MGGRRARRAVGGGECFRPGRGRWRRERRIRRGQEGEWYSRCGEVSGGEEEEEERAHLITTRRKSGGGGAVLRNLVTGL